MSFTNRFQKEQIPNLREIRYKDNQDQNQNNHNLTFDFGINNTNINQNKNYQTFNNRGRREQEFSNTNDNFSKTLRNNSFSNSNEKNKCISANKHKESRNNSKNSRDKNMSRQKSYKEDNDTNYKSILEKKIKSQAERLYELQSYKEILENRILQLNPEEILPVVENKFVDEHIPAGRYNESNSFIANKNIDNKNYKRIGDENVNSSLNFKDAFTSLQNENNFLRLKVANLEKEKVFLRNINLNSEKDNKLDYETEMLNLERIPNESLREAYLNLQEYCNKLKKDKETILQSLNQEVLLSEEQKNYIEILKTIVENSIVNNDLVELLQKQKNFICPQNKTMIEFICDISHLQRELENKINIAGELNSIISNMEKEIQFLKQINMDNDLKREKIVENLSLGISELEETKIYVKKLEYEKNNLNSELSILKTEYENLNFNVKKEKQKLEELQILIEEKDCTITDLNKLVDQQGLLEGKLFEYKDKFQLQNKEFERILLEKDNLEKKNYCIEENCKKIEFSLREKEKLLKETEDKVGVYKNLFEEEKSKSGNHQNLFKEKESEFNKEKNNLNNLLEENSKKIEKLNLESSELNKKLNLEIQNIELLKAENHKLKDDINFKDNENSKFTEKFSDAFKKEKMLLEKIEIMNKDYMDLKKKYDTYFLDTEDLKKKNQETLNEIEILKKEKQQFFNLYEKEKKEFEKEIEFLKKDKHQCLTLYEKDKKEYEKEKDIFKKEKNQYLSLYDKEKKDYEKEIDILNQEKSEFLSLYENEKKVYEKEVESLKKEKNKILNLMDNEKKEAFLKEKLIKALENEILQKSTLISNFNKISNLSFVNIKSAFKNTLNSFDSYNARLIGLKNNLLCEYNTENNFQENYDKYSNNSDFNFRKYVGKDRESILSNIDRKRNERNCNLNDIYKNQPKYLIGNYNKKNTDSSTYTKDVLFAVESFGEWIDITKQEINSTLNTILEYEKNIKNNSLEDFNESNNYSKRRRDTSQDFRRDDNQITENSKSINKTEYFILQEEINRLKNLISDYKNKNEKINRELKSFKNDNKKLYDQNKYQNYNFNSKLSIFERDLLYYKNLILKISCLLNSSNIKNIVEQILEIASQVTELEYERLRLEKNHEKYENELKLFIEKDNNNLENSEIYTELKIKVSNAKNKLLELNRKIQDKKQNILLLENNFNKEKEKEREKGNEIDLDSKSKDKEKIENPKILKNNIFEKFDKIMSKEKKENKKIDEVINNYYNKEIYKISKEANLPEESSIVNLYKKENTEEDDGNRHLKSNHLEEDNTYSEEDIEYRNFNTNTNSNKNIHNENNNDDPLFYKIDNNTVNDFFNNNKATNVFKKNLIDSNKNSESNKNENSKLKIPTKDSITNNHYEDYKKNLNFEYKLNSEIETDKNKNEAVLEHDIDIERKNEEILENQDENEKIKIHSEYIYKEDSEQSEEKENNNYRDCFNDNNKKKERNPNMKFQGISIDTEKINEKYEKILNKNPDCNHKKNESQNENSINLIEEKNKIQEDLKPITDLKSEFREEMPIRDRINSEIQNLKLPEKKIYNQNLNFYYDLTNDEFDSQQNNVNKNLDIKDKSKSNINSTKNSIEENDNKKNYNFDYKRNLNFNIERNKRDIKKNNHPSLLSDDIDKFCKSPERITSRQIQTESSGSNNIINKNHIKEIYSCSNNFTFNNNQETENSWEKKSDKTSIKCAEEGSSNVNLKEKDYPALENYPKNLNVAVKKKGFGRRNFDIDI